MTTQVHVFITDPGNDNPGAWPDLLVVPALPDVVIPTHLRGGNWRYFATTTVDDVLLIGAMTQITDDLKKAGYSIVSNI